MEKCKNWSKEFVRINYPMIYIEGGKSLFDLQDQIEQSFFSILENNKSLSKFFKDKECIIRSYPCATSSTIKYLMSQAVQYCDKYAEDLFYSWQTVREYLDFTPMKKFQYWFGFRDMGVDSDAFINARISSPGCYGDIGSCYKAVFVLEVDKDKNSMNLYKVF